jgi:hypothetical protein
MMFWMAYGSGLAAWPARLASVTHLSANPRACWGRPPFLVLGIKGIKKGIGNLACCVTTSQCEEWISKTAESRPYFPRLVESRNSGPAGFSRDSAWPSCFFSAICSLPRILSSTNSGEG